MAIANTIKQQFYAIGAIKVLSWDAHAFVAIESGLQFKVKGYIFQGYVRIHFDANQDLYNIALGHIHNYQWVETKRNGSFWDQMVDLLDEVIESGSEATTFW